MSDWPWPWLKRLIRRLRFARTDRKADAPLVPDKLKTMVRAVVSTRPDEIGCDECFEQLDQFVEMVLAGKNAAEALPLVHDHLERCGDCREEFEALLRVVQQAAA